MRFPDSVLNSVGGAVYRIALAKTGDCELSRDIVQQTFVILFEKKPAFSDKTALRVWMIRAAIKLISNHYKKSENARTVPLEEARDIATADTLTVEFYDLLCTLPSAYRDTVVLYYIDDMSEKDIARALSISQGTVKSRLSRARGILSKIYKEELL